MKLDSSGRTKMIKEWRAWNEKAKTPEPSFVKWLFMMEAKNEQAKNKRETSNKVEELREKKV